MYRIVLFRFRQARDLVLPTYIFRTKPSVSTVAFRSLFRFLAGLEDFARVNAHYPRRRLFPVLADDRFKRHCLYCIIRAGKFILDSEWHALFECPCCDAPRSLFSYKYSIPNDVAGDSGLNFLVTLVISAGKDVHLTNELARLVVGVISCRRRAFKSLASEIPLRLGSN